MPSTVTTAGVPPGEEGWEVTREPGPELGWLEESSSPSVLPVSIGSECNTETQIIIHSTQHNKRALIFNKHSIIIIVRV